MNDNQNVNSLLQDLDIENTLQCPVCYEIPPKIIYMCKIGHHMCERCRMRLNSCPTCKSAITGCRNFLGENLTNKISALMRGNGDGDGSRNNNNLEDATSSILDIYSISKSLKDNVNRLPQILKPSGSYMCLLESCRYTKKFGVSLMVKHVETTHGHIYDKFQNTTATFKNKFENFCFKKCIHKYHRAFNVTNMGLFFLNLETVPNQYINCWISSPANLKWCHSLYYEIVFSREDSNKTLTFVNKMASTTENKMRVLETGKLFVITPEFHALTEGEFFSLDVKIVYQPFSPPATGLPPTTS